MNIAEEMNQIYHKKWFTILVHERYKFNKLIQLATESELRQAFGDDLQTLQWIIEEFRLNCSEDFKREVKECKATS